MSKIAIVGRGTSASCTAQVSSTWVIGSASDVASLNKVRARVAGFPKPPRRMLFFGAPHAGLNATLAHRCVELCGQDMTTLPIPCTGGISCGSARGH